ncbi:MAG TPA: transglycosylase SLT domain-containing protein [Terriglobales bacterium]|nr:transglycosylase SLT domain-containing protein [Terriglobales bacterium]
MSVRQVLLALVILALPCAPLAAAQQPGSAAPKKHSTKKKPARKSPAAPSPLSGGARQAQQAFVASADLKPMAVQLLTSRSRAAYSGVEAYAVRHAGDDAGALAWLVIGYAHTLDAEYGPAVDALRQARPHAGVVGDYVDYLLASSLVASRAHTQAIEILQDFPTRYPDSSLLHDAVLLQADALLALNRSREAATLLEAHRLPAHPDTELTLGRAYLALGENAKAAEALRVVYYTMPLSPLADEAEAQLRGLSKQGTLPAPGYTLRKTRAEQLAQARQYRDATDEYQKLLPDTPASEQPAVQLALGGALFRARRSKQARDVLERIPAGAPGNDERLYYLTQIAAHSDRYVGLLNQLRQNAPKSPWLAQLLISDGNERLLQKDLPGAIRFYKEVYQRAPDGQYSDYAHWKTAWLTFRLGNTEEAKKLFEEQVALYPASNQVPAAIYWRARLAEEDKDLNKARVWYQKIVERFRLYYYGDLARERIRVIGAGSSLAPDPLLAKMPPAPRPPAFSSTLPAEDSHAQRARLLENAALFDFAMRELQEESGRNHDGWALRQMVRIYEQRDSYYRGLQLLKKTVPSYFTYDISALPRDLWEGLFPRIYWSDLTKQASAQGLDPFLVAALIRQESEFNPRAVSHAHAMGLMQLLPSSGRKIARQVKLPRYSTQRLLEPDVNLQLGTVYFRQALDQYGGTLEYALAAYNAGDNRVEEWRKDGTYRDVAEFVESIPFTETREYVQAILRNANVYRRLYGNP